MPNNHILFALLTTILLRLTLNLSVGFVSGKVGVFTFEGKTPIGMIGDKPADSPSINAIARRPGVFAPLSKFHDPPQESIKAGFSLNLALDLRDDNNTALTSSALLSTDPTRFTVFAVGEVTVAGEKKSVTYDQEVIAGEDNQVSDNSN